jgi:hypothetical protein
MSSLDEYLGDPEAAKRPERLGRELAIVAARITRPRHALGQAERRDTDARHRAGSPPCGAPPGRTASRPAGQGSHRSAEKHSGPCE